MFISELFIWIITSIGIIYIIHCGWNYLKENYSTQKTKDLVNPQIQKYKKMVDEIQRQHQQTQICSPFETNVEKQQMNEDLMQYVNSLSNDNVTV